MSFFRPSPLPPSPRLDPSLPRTLPPFPMRDHSSFATLYTGEHSDELWQACAGPLVYVPKSGENVWYFPQGHMEQVAASTQQPGSLQQLPNSGLDSQILCRVLSRSLRAELDTDEVYAQISLLPVAPEVGDSCDVKNTQSDAPPQSSLRMFTKILTASDTSTHGGFSVLRKHAEECLPPLDMSQDPPSQDLAARDLHGHEWKFKHTYRGHPKRHLLTTGWSVFVSNKRLQAGDAVIFLRGENGDLRVGIRRAKRQQTVQQAVMSSHSMHMGVVATANYAVGTRTMFSVYYKPRVSHSSFLVPVEQLSKMMSVSLSVGMRFKMQFETEDASDRSCMGTITGIEDLDSASWPCSKWRSLKVNWDENNSDRPDRVSPWEIEVCQSSPVTNPQHPVRNKRGRVSPMASTVADLPGLSSGSTALLSSALQSQDPQAIGVGSLWRNENPHPFLMHVQQQQPQQRHHHTSMLQHVGVVSGVSSSQLSGSRTSSYIPQPETVISPGVQPSGIGGHGSVIHGSAWSTAPHDASQTWLMSLLSNTSNASSWQDKPPLTGNTTFPVVAQQKQQNHSQHTYPNASSSFVPWDKSMKRENVVASPNSAAIASSLPAPPTPSVTESKCKLFGISLTDTPILSAKVNRHLHDPQNAASVDNELVSCQQAYAQINESELSRHVKSEASSDQEKPEQNVVESRNNLSTRSRVKVIKKGSMVGRGIDLNKFDNYISLLKELESMFNMEGELTDPTKGWQVAYIDSEGDKMQVGDDPWPEFCRMVKKLHILSPEEIQNRDQESCIRNVDHGLQSG